VAQKSAKNDKNDSQQPMLTSSIGNLVSL